MADERGSWTTVAIEGNVRTLNLKEPPRRESGRDLKWAVRTSQRIELMSQLGDGGRKSSIHLTSMTIVKFIYQQLFYEVFCLGKELFWELILQFDYLLKY